MTPFIEVVDIPIFLICLGAAASVVYMMFVLGKELWLFYKKLGFSTKFFSLVAVAYIWGILSIYAAWYNYGLYTSY